MTFYFDDKDTIEFSLAVVAVARMACCFRVGRDATSGHDFAIRTSSTADMRLGLMPIYYFVVLDLCTQHRGYSLTQ